MTDRISGLATYGWKTGAWIRPLPFSAVVSTGNASGFQTLLSPGDVAAVGAPFPWSVHFGLDYAPGPRARLITHGFSIADANTRGDEVLVCLAVEPSVLLGECSMHVNPQLFSGDMDVRAIERRQWLEQDNYCVLLRVEAVGDFQRFCLVAGSNEPTELQAIAQRYLEEDAQAKWDIEWNRRLRYLQDAGADGDRAEVLAAACEDLHARLRAPEGELAHIWSAADAPEESAFDLNQLYPLVMAWIQLDPPVARQILNCAFDTQADDGSLAAVVQPVGRAVNDAAPLPLLATAAARVYSTNPQEDFLAAALPKLESYLAWALRYFGTEGSGVPRWPERNAAWHPAEFDDPAAKRDAAHFLLAEINAFMELARQAPADAVDTALWQREQDRLQRVAPSPPDAPKRGSELHRFVYARVFGKDVDRTDLAPATRAQSGEIMAAALCVAQQPVSRQIDTQPAVEPSATNWLEQHRRPVLLVTAIVLGTLLIGATSFSLFKKSLNVPAAETIFGLAQRLHQEGRFEEAIQLYRQIETSSRNVYPVELPLANAHFKLGQWAEAEAYYRTAAERDPASPRPALNLCLTLYRQDRLGEADGQYLAFIEKFGTAYPELGQRAAKARALIAEQQAGSTAAK